MEVLLAEVVASEAWVRSEAVALAERIGPLSELSWAALELRARLERAEQLLREAAVAGAAEAHTVAEADRLRQRVARHEEELALARVEVRALKERLRRNAAAHALCQQQQLLTLRDPGGAGQAAGKKTALRSAEAGTGALREAAAAMRREAERFQAAREETEQGGLGIGRGLVTRLERRDFTDRVLIGFAVLVFGLVCGYIFKARTIG